MLKRLVVLLCLATFFGGVAAARAQENAPAASSGISADRTALEEANRKLVIDFYKRALFDLDLSAVDEYLGDVYIQHNPLKLDGREPVKSYINGLKATGGRPASKIEHAYVDGDIVVLHVHAKKDVNDIGFASVDIFRVKDGKIVEHWDVYQDIPATSKNKNGVF